MAAENGNYRNASGKQFLPGIRRMDGDKNLSTLYMDAKTPDESP